MKQAYKAVTTLFIMFESKRRTYYNPHPFKARRLSFLKIFLVMVVSCMDDNIIMVHHFIVVSGIVSG